MVLLKLDSSSVYENIYERFQDTLYYSLYTTLSSKNLWNEKQKNQVVKNFPIFMNRWDGRLVALDHKSLW